MNVPPLRFLHVSILAISVAGCAATRVQRIKDPVRTIAASSRADLRLVERLRTANAADRTDAQKGLVLWLELSRITAAGALSEGKDSADRAVYNYACARAAHDLQGIGWDQLPASLALHGGLVRMRYLSTSIDLKTLIFLQPAADYRVLGMTARHIKPGIGGALVANRKAAKGEKFVPRNGFFTPMTAVISWKGAASVDIVFCNTLLDNDVVIGGRKVPLAADYTAPIAAQASRQRSQGIDLIGFLRPQLLFPDFGLFMRQPYDPTKIPVVFTHGLLSRPEAFKETLNTLQADPATRARYQFWYFRYPSGLPTMVTAARLHRDLGRTLAIYDPKRRNRAFENTVLIGHSMGSIISNMQVRDRSGLRAKIFINPMRLVSFGTGLDEVVTELYKQPPAQQVSLLIFICAPHRGSELAMSPVAQLFSALVAVPRDFLALAPGRTLNGLTDFGRTLMHGPPQSIYSLSPKNKSLELTLELPLKPGATYASIIGDRGRGDTPNSSDGVVPYWSSHLDAAISEKIEPYTHEAEDRALTIAEVRRLLLAHATKGAAG